jgi:hypothetical protein
VEHKEVWKKNLSLLTTNYSTEKGEKIRDQKLKRLWISATETKKKNKSVYLEDARSRSELNLPHSDLAGDAVCGRLGLWIGVAAAAVALWKKRWLGGVWVEELREAPRLLFYSQPPPPRNLIDQLANHSPNRAFRREAPPAKLRPSHCQVGPDPHGGSAERRVLATGVYA